MSKSKPFAPSLSGPAPLPPSPVPAWPAAPPPAVASLSAEGELRRAVSALDAAWQRAEASGLVVRLPFGRAALARLEISETAAVPPATAAATPTTNEGD